MTKRHLLLSLLYNQTVILLLFSCQQEEIDTSQFGFVEKLGNDSCIVFMHISDTHESDKTSHIMTEMLNTIPSIDFGIISGDIQPTYSMLKDLQTCKKPIYVVPGNHDAYNNGGQYTFRKNVANAMPKQQYIHWGNDTANYYYTDYTKNHHTLRIICLDQYETDIVGVNPEGGIIMSQQQINWLCQLLEHSDTVSALMLQMHCGYGNKNYGARDTSNFNEFISIYGIKYENSYDYHSNGHPLMIPEIIYAYQTGNNILGRRYCTGILGDTLTINTNFKHASNNFLGHFGGHLHWDLVEYLPSYSNPKQLQVLMTFCGWGNGQCNYNDIYKTITGKNSYNINVNLIDFKKRQIMIRRIGANKKIDGTFRDSIIFNY